MGSGGGGGGGEDEGMGGWGRWGKQGVERDGERSAIGQSWGSNEDLDRQHRHDPGNAKRLLGLIDHRVRRCRAAERPAGGARGG